MRKVTRIVLAALFLQFFVGGVSAEAATATLRISGVSVNATAATVKWNSMKLSSKDFFEVEFTKTSSAKTYRVIKTKSSAIVAKLDPFTQYTVRIRKTLTPKVWSSIRTFTTRGDAVTGLALSNVSYLSADVSWNPVVGASAYDILVNDALLVSVTTTKYTLTNLKPGSNTSVVVRPKSGLILGSPSSALSITTLNAAPTKLVASSITTAGSTLAWQAVTGADSYNVYADKKLLINTKSLTHTISDRQPGTTVNYSVTAVFGNSESLVSDSVEVTTLIDTPAAVTASSITTNSFAVSWALDKNATGYEVTLYDSLGTSVVKTNLVNSSLSTTTFTGLTPLTVYTVGIKNTYANASSKQSALTTVSTLKLSITGVVLSNITTTSATLNWSSLPGVASYEVARDGVPVAAATAALTTTSVSYTFATLAPGATYKFAIRATYLDGAKVLQTTDWVEVQQQLLTDPSFAPTSSTVPVITLPYASVPIVGATLTASTGTWTSTPAITSYTYQWQRSLDDGGSWAALAGETKATYKVVASDYAFKLRVVVTAINANGTRVAASLKTSAVAETYNVQIPVVRGTLVSGQLLEVTDGTWSSDYPLTFRYQWKRDGVNISNAISPSYTLTDTDVNTVISVTVIAYSSLGSVSSDSTIRSSVAAVGNTVAPAITGTVKVNQTLTTSDGTWLASPSLTYQWQRSSDGVLWNNIASATNATYVITTSDTGFYIRSQVFGSRTITSTTYRFVANSVATIIVPGFTLVSSTAPVVTGSWTTGSTLTTTNGTWSSSGTFTYQWQRSTDNSTWSSISSATSSSYVLTADDASKYVRVQVYLAGSSGADGIAYSVSTAKVGAPYNTLAPAITGTLRVGNVQTVSTGTWSGSPTFTYQWQTSSDGIAWANIDGATNSTYTITYSEANLRVRARVSGTNAVDTATASSQVIVGFLAPIATAVPVITSSGDFKSGQTLTSTAGTWPNTSSGYTYTWQRSADGGTTWTNISGAITSTYVLVTGDVGYLIRSEVTVTTNTGSSTAYSLPTVAIAPA
jgi:hypothetical protein